MYRERERVKKIERDWERYAESMGSET